MQNNPSLAIGVRITKSDETIIDVDDLWPLLISTSDLLEAACADSVYVSNATLRKAEHSLTLASLDGLVIFLACNSEETTNRRETEYLVQRRRRELAEVFGKVMNSSTPPSDRYAVERKSVTALFLLAAAFQSAQKLVIDGNSRQKFGEYLVESMYLRVTSDDDSLHFDIVPHGTMKISASESFH